MYVTQRSGDGYYGYMGMPPCFLPFLFGISKLSRRIITETEGVFFGAEGITQATNACFGAGVGQQFMKIRFQPALHVTCTISFKSFPLRVPGGNRAATI